ncbi:ADP-ribosylation/crystallin J1 [Flavobacterium endoglycinae]|uniref:ADP-ribosylation/crystallin J1 n=1 Tax=Flavobacterium endoglycinae TaxID=2816357 RepID=A0ABX7Q7U5_9FLAO|nr:ADP-ribosylation/crystallin J1 [Flavobacterium endoglycinae]QSW87095.1 ADP-ribosylation/crystallin J1 [Flavobacterium endoglycinae]
METTRLYRPVGLKEVELIAELDYNAFPPRLEWQPIFYPVTNQQYADQIAFEWNTVDEFSGFIGIVTAFDVNSDFLKKYEIQNVGDKNHNELWIPSEELIDFNANIVNGIEIVNVHFTDRSLVSENKELNEKLDSFRK